MVVMVVLPLGGHITNIFYSYVDFTYIQNYFDKLDTSSEKGGTFCLHTACSTVWYVKQISWGEPHCSIPTWNVLPTIASFFCVQWTPGLDFFGGRARA